MLRFIATQILGILLLIGSVSGAQAGLIGIGGRTIAPDDVMSLFSIDTNTGASTLIGSTGIGGLQGLAHNVFRHN